MGRLIRTTGEESDYPRAGKTYSLEELQGAVGGYIEIISLRDGRLMVLNEEGKLKALPPNPAATLLARRVIQAADWVVGDVVVCNNDEVS